MRRCFVYAGPSGPLREATASRVREKRSAPEPSATPAQDQGETQDRVQRQRFVQDRHAVDDGERREGT